MMACMQKSLYRKERRKKKELDNLSLDMIQCRKDGYGCHYGAWKAAKNRPVTIEKKTDELPKGWRICKYCGKPFKPKQRGIQLYCEYYCADEAAKERYRERNRERQQQYREKKKAEGSGEDGQQS
jgi:hypothetical protein